jgi:hypothetical protein
MLMAARVAPLSIAVFAIGCSATVTDATGSGATNPAYSLAAPAFTGRAVDKIDLLFVIENAPRMADLAPTLALAIPDLVTGFANPLCLDDASEKPTPTQPAGPLDACPANSRRQFTPVLDMHVGVLSSSLGLFGLIGWGCADAPLASCPTSTETPTDDHGHLVHRSDSCNSKGTLPTYQGLGFLAYDPAQQLSPPGIATVGSLAGALRDIVVGVGSDGCYVPSQNEAWYRFLVDPAPYDEIQYVNNQVVVNGVDQVLLKQRQAFLRPDSLLVIVNVSDSDDASLKAYGSYPSFATKLNSGYGLISYPQQNGAESFYPPSRYVNALTSPTVKDPNGNDAPNPIYAGASRDPGLVFYAGIVGVPWQFIARQDQNGVPDLIAGLDNGSPPEPVGGFKTGKELALTDPQGNTFWDDIAGDPENYQPAKSPFMVESMVPRVGTDPITGFALDPPSTPNGAGNPVNDHEWPVVLTGLEYACIFPLATPIDESVAAGNNGDCVEHPLDNPLCSPNPSDGQNTLQTKAKAYPGVKHLAIARGMGAQGIAASICPKQLTDENVPDFGYRPAMNAVTDRLRQQINGTCLTRPLTPDATGQVACVVLEGLKVGAGQACSCDTSKGRWPVSVDHQPAVLAAQAASKGLDCFCELAQTSGAALKDCQTSLRSSANGWCYVDAADGPAQAALTERCPSTEPREIRFVGSAEPQSGATVFIACPEGS